MIRKLLLAATVLLAPFPANAIPIAQMELTGQGLLPLAFEPGSSTHDYGLVDSTVELSAVGGSDVTTTFDFLILTEAEVAIDFMLFVEIRFTDNAPGVGNDYTGKLAPSFTLTPAEALKATVSGNIDFTNFDPNDPFATVVTTIQTTSKSIKEDLGVDVNQNGEFDFIELRIKDFLLDENDLNFEFVDPATPAAGLIVTSASLTLSGQVADVTADPPFTLQLSTPAVDAPSTMALMVVGLVGLGFARRQRRH